MKRTLGRTIIKDDLALIETDECTDKPEASGLPRAEMIGLLPEYCTAADPEPSCLWLPLVPFIAAGHCPLLHLT